MKLLKLNEKQKIQYSEPAYYIISVAGKIHPDIVPVITNFYSGNLVNKIQNENTLLEGLIKDQVALSGLLNYLSELHYILLSVETQEKK